MSRDLYLDLAARGFAMPLAVDLFVHSYSTAEKVEEDPAEMAGIMEKAARAYRTQLAVAPMDLRVEKAALGEMLGVAAGDRATYHLHDLLDNDTKQRLLRAFEGGAISKRMEVTCSALHRVAQSDGMLPVGMVIGPFSFLTKVMDDIITTIYLLGQGMDAEDEESIGLAEQLLEVSTALVKSYAAAQVKAGAKAIIMCEPAANKVYISPKSMESGSDVFERCVLKPCAAVRDTITGLGADLILHDCGELTPEMIAAMASLRPAMLSLGSCVSLPDAAAHVPKDVVLFGNVPSKFFPSDVEMPLKKVKGLCEGLLDDMGRLGHPFILGSECDVLSVPGKEATIRAKADAIAEYSKG